MMPGLECPELTVRWPAGSSEAKLGQCRIYALRDGFLTHDATGKFDRKEGWKDGKGPEWRRNEGGAGHKNT